MSGWTGNDTLSGDDVVSLNPTPGIPGSEQGLTPADFTRISGLDVLVGTRAQADLADVPLAGNTLSNVVIGGPGDDSLRVGAETTSSTVTPG